MTSNASVKWFNNKKGFGFLTDCNTGEDIFVHNSAINVPEDIYRTLIKGEYVQYELSNDNDKQLALNVTGIQGGNLLCQLENTRVYLVNTSRGNEYGSEENTETITPNHNKGQNLGNSRGRGRGNSRGRGRGRGHSRGRGQDHSVLGVQTILQKEQDVDLVE